MGIITFLSILPLDLFRSWEFVAKISVQAHVTEFQNITLYLI